MSSNPIRGIRRKKSSLTEVKIAVLGAPGVGKSGEQHPYVKFIICTHTHILYGSECWVVDNKVELKGAYVTDSKVNVQ